MDVVIPSSGRPICETWNNLPEGVREHTRLCVYEEEAEAYRRYPLIVVPPSVRRGIGHKRQWLIEQYDGPLVMLDDDLCFAQRNLDDLTKFHKPTETSMLDLFRAMREDLEGYAHGGVSPRQGANNCTDQFCWNQRNTRFHYFNTLILRKEGVRFDRIPVMEDFDVTLQLLRKGYKQKVLNYWVHDQRATGSKGGCSNQRTLEVQNLAAEQLKRLHHEFVRVKTKQNKSAFGGQPHTDVTVYWKKAFNRG